LKMIFLTRTLVREDFFADGGFGVFFSRTAGARGSTSFVGKRLGAPMPEFLVWSVELRRECLAAERQDGRGKNGRSCSVRGILRSLRSLQNDGWKHNMGFQRDVSLWRGAGREPCIIEDSKSKACLAPYSPTGDHKAVRLYPYRLAACGKTFPLQLHTPHSSQ
jgi:hypothetical protein